MCQPAGPMCHGSTANRIDSLADLKLATTPEFLDYLLNSFESPASRPEELR